MSFRLENPSERYGVAETNFVYWTKSTEASIDALARRCVVSAPRPSECITVQNSELLAAAKELHAIHGILPVAASGKAPMGGTGWNTLALATRLLYFNTPACTGLGFQAGPVFHPYYGPCDLRVIDIDEKDPHKRDAFALMFLHLLGDDAKKITWRWGRGPACAIFTRGEHKREKYGSVQFLGPGKYAVGWGGHPDVGEYRWPDGDIFKTMPPLLDVKRVEACILAAGVHAGIVMETEKHAFNGSIPEITGEQLSMLSDSDLERYHAELTSELDSIGSMPSNSGYNRGDRLHSLGLRFGALSRHDPRFGAIVSDAIARLPGHENQGDVRDFTRGLRESKGLSLLRAVTANQQKSMLLEYLKPKGTAGPGQELNDLMQEHIPALRWLIERYFAACRYAVANWQAQDREVLDHSGNGASDMRGRQVLGRAMPSMRRVALHA